MATTNPTNRLRVMVDANILIAGTGWPRFPYEVLQHAVRGDYVLVLSPFVIAEAQRHIERLLPDALATFDGLLQEIEYEAADDPSPEEVAAQMALVRDPKDVPVALAAINAQVDYLVTQDRDFTDEDESTTELHRRLNILLPGTFLREQMGWTSDQLEVIRSRTWQDFEE